MHRGYIKGILYMVYFNKIRGDKPVIISRNTTGAAGNTAPKVTVVPVGQKADKKEDTDKLPQGYCVEKSQNDTPPVQEPASIPTEAPTSEPTETPAEETPSSETEPASQDNDTDSVPDTKMHTDERIELSESITIASDDSRPIQDALDNAIRRSQSSLLNNKDVDYITKAESMIKHDTFQPLEMEYKKGLHASGLTRYELNDYNYDVAETDTHIKWKSNSERIDLKGTYESNSGNTKLFGYLKSAVTRNNVLIENPKLQELAKNDENNNYEETGDGGDKPDIQPIPDISNFKSKSNEYCAYLGLKQKFNNGNVLTATGFHDKNESQMSHTTQFDALYDLGFADITGCVTVYKLGVTKPTVKTNLSCKLKTFDNPADTQISAEQATDEQTVQNEDNTKKQESIKSNGKKWDKKGGLLLEFESEDDHEQGIGYYWDFRKNETNSKTKFTVFAKGSTTQRGEDETSSYHITAGANLQYKEKISPKYLFDLSLDAKNKLTFGGKDKGNITTAFGKARLTSKKLIAELEGKLILAKDTYKALSLRLGYKLNKKVEISAEGSATNQNESGIKLKGYTGLASLYVAL